MTIPAVPVHGEKLLQRARQAPGPVAVPRADNLEALEALAMALADGIVQGGVLIGERGPVEAMADRASLPLGTFDIVPCQDDAQASRQALELAASGQVRFVLKGQLDTRVLLRTLLDRSLGLVPEGRILTHVAMTGIPGHPRPLFFSDAAILITPSLEEKVQAIHNLVGVATALGVEHPRVSLIAAVEKVNPRIEATLHAAEIARRAREGAFPGVEVAGPHDLYIATSEEGARIKGVQDEVAGRADALLFPDLNTANVFYKTLPRFLPGAWNAGIVAGAAVPVLLPSRADPPICKRMGILLAAALAAGRA